MKKGYLLALVVIVVVVVAAAVYLLLPKSQKTSGVLRVGTDACYEPFESIDEDGNFVGFDMELIAMIADELGLKLEGSVKNLVLLALPS